MIGFALQLGTNAAAETMVQLAGLGTRQARAMRTLFTLPFNAVDAAVEAAFGPRFKPAPPRGNAGSGIPSAPASADAEVRADATPCPDAEMLAAYADHGLNAEEQNRIENHLVECDICRSRVAIVVGAPDPGEVCTAYRA